MAHPSAIVLELHFFPSLQYLSKFLAYDTVIIEQWEHYQKGSYRNRCHIAGANGLLRLSVPLGKGKNEQLPIQKTTIAYDENWQANHWNSIRAAYNNSPFYEFYADEILAVFKEHHEFLFQLNLKLLLVLLELLDIKTPIQFTSAYQKAYQIETFDLRNSILPKKHRQKKDSRFQQAPYPQVFMEKTWFFTQFEYLRPAFLRRTTSKNNTRSLYP